MSKVYFIGAGPGDVELITIKGQKILHSADVVIYTGSLINPLLLEGVKGDLHDSSKMTLEEIVNLMEQSINRGKKVARLHTGDPTIFSAIGEQIRELKKRRIPYEIIPGVSSAFAAASIIGTELTEPEISQTVIFTRIEGKTPVPSTEKLGELSKHRATMVIFLSVGMIDRVKEELLKGYDENTPFVVIYKGSWPEQKIVKGLLKELDKKVKEEGITKTALIMVGEVFSSPETRSKLYDPGFNHEYRK